MFVFFHRGDFFLFADGFYSHLLGYFSSFVSSDWKNIAWFHPGWINVFSAEKRAPMAELIQRLLEFRFCSTWEIWRIWIVTAYHCSSSFFWRIVPRYERIIVRNHGQIVGILSQAGYHQGWSAFAQNLIHFWSVEWGYILPLKTSMDPKQMPMFFGGFKIQAADRSKNWWGMMTRSIICSHWKPKKCGWFRISQNFCWASERLVFYQKLGHLDWIFSSTHWKSNSAAGQPRMVPTVWHRKNGGGKQGEKTWPTKGLCCACAPCCASKVSCCLSKHGFRWRMVWAAILFHMMFAIFAISFFCTIGDKFINAYDVCDADE